VRAALTFFARPGAKWVALAFWLAVFVGLNSANIFDRFAEAEKNRSVDYLPAKAESVKVLEQIEQFPSGERFAAVVVYRRDGGLNERDRAAIAQDRRQGFRPRSPVRPDSRPTRSRCSTRSTARCCLPPRDSCSCC
jgi:RND superfamily putative drug exporter